MSNKISINPSDAAVLLKAIFEVLTPQQTIRLVEEIKKLESLGYGRLTLVINAGHITQIQILESYDFRADLN